MNCNIINIGNQEQGSILNPQQKNQKRFFTTFTNNPYTTIYNTKTVLIPYKSIEQSKPMLQKLIKIFEFNLTKTITFLVC